MEARLDPDHSIHEPQGIIAVISRQVAPDWREFNLRRKKTVRKMSVPDGLLRRVGVIAQAYELPLLSRLIWVQARFPTEQLEILVEECEWLFSVLNDSAAQDLLQKIGTLAAQTATTRTQYPNIHWLLTARHSEALHDPATSQTVQEFFGP